MQGREAYHTLAHTHTPSLSALGSRFQLSISLMRLHLLGVPVQFSYRAKHSKNLNTVAPGSGYPVVLLVCNRQETKTTEQVHRWGLQGREQI